MKKGSALLVVLGMLAFMLFSGLAFSVYMRQSRLPTSFLRRTAATRQLAKAALAEAIEEIDSAIGNDPHPGVMTANTREDCIGNAWKHRVFVGYSEANTTCTYAGELGLTSEGSEVEGQVDFTKMPYLADLSETVPVLTLEGLAYLPPNLINDVRYYSQRTATAKWHSFWFDSGRYAYVAVDVSDYFDVNRVFANKPRAACASRRVSLAHVFEESEDEDHLHTGPGTGAKEWDDFMKDYRLMDDDGKAKGSAEPLVSLADLNVEWISNGPSDLPSPFSNYLKGNNVYGSTSGTDEKSEKYRCMTFVTDGWFPTSESDTAPTTGRKKVDLCSEQPFDDSKLNGSSMPNLIDTMSFGSDDADSYLGKHLCRLGRTQLWDYLDVNRVPVSLAVPTCERVPMISGIEMSVLPTFEFTTTKSESYDNETDTSRTITRKYECKISLDGPVGVKALAAYPFLTRGIADQEQFSVDGSVAVFLTIDGQTMTLRPGAGNKSLHLTKSSVSGGQSAAPTADSVFSVALTSQQIKSSSIAKTESEPVQAVPLTGTAQSGAVPFYTVTCTWQQTKPKNSSAWTPSDPNFAKDIVSADTSASFYALDKNGVAASDFDASFASKIANGINVCANAAVWLRVTYNDPDMGQKTVDLVPACLDDDVELNGAPNSNMAQQFFGGSYPLMRFDAKMGGQSTLNVKADGVTGKHQLTIDNPRILVSDPRYNHAPENWYVLPGTGIAPQDWVSAATAVANGRDGDIYMFTSDAGYMQSVYELAYLPRMTDLSSKDGGNAWGPTGNYPTTYPTMTAFETDPAKVKDYSFMWRTYDCFNATEAERFREIGLVCGENGMKVNPYSDSTRVLMAALANTPHDWRVASTNEDYAVVPSGEMKDAATFNKKHAWNAYSPKVNGAICWDCLEEFAEKFSGTARYLGDWEAAFAGLGWSSDKRKLLSSINLDSEDSDLYSVDKKFLYGFWHDSFAARQQLFLVFVRAEPMMMGGGVSGQAPPQLGARAVALVWRDPTATKELSSGSSDSSTAYPHRSRILFYHQFD